jgi:outer membrane protein TolC
MRLRPLIILVILALASSMQGQVSLSLKDVIRIAADSSLAAFKARNLYQASYWEFRAYTAQKKPILSFDSYPVYYTRSLTKRYNSILDIDEYREEQSFYSSAGLTLTQNLPLSGGSLYINTQVDRLQNFGENDYTQFSTVPVKVGISQPLFGFNEFKWKRRIEPLKYEKAKKVYIQSVENISLQVLAYFFDLIAADIKVGMAEINLANADTLYNIGQQRLQIASLSQADVLTLKVEALNANNELASAKKELQSARFSFNSYLKIDNRQQVKLLLPDSLFTFQVNYDQALTMALERNPDQIDYQQQVLESARDMEQTKRKGIMDASLRASFGLNQESSNLTDSYHAPLDQQNTMISLSVPLIDWGQRRGQYNMAKNNYEAVMLTAEQAEIDFQQKILLTVSDFNMQQEVVKTALETRAVARQAYNITKQRFVIGKTDVNSLSLALERQDKANLNYIEALWLYWEYYYSLRQLTLYDFENNRALIYEFDALMGLE